MKTALMTMLVCSIALLAAAPVAEAGESPVACATHPDWQQCVGVATGECLIVWEDNGRPLCISVENND